MVENNLPSQSTSKATIYVTCTFGDTDIRALLDTGAEITLMNETVFNNLKHSPKLRPTKLTVSGPSKSHSLNITGEADINFLIAGYYFCWTVYICNNLTQSMLIGQDFLKVHRAVINLCSNELCINGKTTKLYNTQSLEACRVSINETYIVPARTVCNVTCRITGSCGREGLVGLLEPTSEFEQKYETGVIKVVASVSNGTIPVRMFNPRQENVKIWKGSTIGQFMPLLDHSEIDNKELPRHCYFIQKCDEKSDRKTQVLNINKAVSDDLKTEMKKLFPVHNENVPDCEKELHYELLARHSKAISRDSNDIGHVKEFQHTIDTGNAYPIKVPIRRMAPLKRQIINDEVKSMLRNDIIEESSSPWSASVVIVHKKDGGTRFCIDYRGLNEVTKKDVYPLPRGDDILESLNNANYFSHFDLVDLQHAG